MRAAAAALAALLAACSGQATPRTAAELTNPKLSPEHSQWLVGPVARIAAPEEIAQFLGLADDAAAARFVAAFWERRDPHPERPGNPVRELFERRAVEADRRFSEAGYRGRRTDRGTTFVLFGEPEAIEFEVNRHAGEPPLEVWTYPAGAPPGLHGRTPSRTYRFVKQGDLTVLYRDTPVDSRRILRETG